MENDENKVEGAEVAENAPVTEGENPTTAPVEETPAADAPAENADEAAA